ncbi:hypothetical protein TTRE_0000716601 [Trichuris trichiura]|uniref:Uncharacterized protein n=1 Tax=Trichuris trichiura TaxID=36087 RepID=A0A077ZJS3_TRITR|nr:hypothetical protein TTRE_0000716601 [Trichuris trichiura]
MSLREKLLELQSNVQLKARLSQRYQQFRLQKEVPELYPGVWDVSTVYKFRKLHPKCFLGVSFSVEIPDEDEVQITMSGVAITADFVPPTVEITAANDIFRKDTADSSQKSESIQGRFDHIQLSDRVNNGFALPQQKVESGDVFVTALMEPPAGSRIEKYLGYYDFFFIRETGAVREIGGVDSFVQMALSEIMTIIRSHVAASGGNGMVSFKFNVSELSDSVGRNQAQLLVSVSGDIVTTVSSSN